MMSGLPSVSTGLKGFEFPSDTHKRTDYMDPIYCISNVGEHAKESLSRIKDGGVHKGSLIADGDAKIKKAVRECLEQDVEIFNDPRHLAIISVKINFFEQATVYKVSMFNLNLF